MAGAAACYEHVEGAATRPLLSGYRRREPEKTVLHEVIREHLETFLAQAAEDGRGLPRHVEGELRKYLACGILSEGFTRVVCRACGDEKLVAFSCKGRTFCPSCCTRRMHDTAAHLVDNVLPEAPFRQWVLAYPHKLRLLLACNAGAATESTHIFLREVFRWQRRKAKRQGLSKPRVGAVCFTQRFGGRLNLNLHHHAVLPDAVFVEAAEGIRLEKLEPPRREELEGILERIVVKTLAMVRQRGLLEAEPPTDAMASLRAEAVQPGLLAPFWPTANKGLSAFREGFSLEAGTHVHQNDRQGLEHLCRYALRPPLALNRLSRGSDGRLVLRLKRTMRDGTSQVAFTPLQLIRRLAALVPPARWNQTRYFGLFAPRAKHRNQVVPVPGPLSVPSGAQPAAKPHSYRLPWALLLARTFALDVLTCDCGGSRQVLAFLPETRVAQEALRRLGLPSTSPPISPPRAALRQDELDLLPHYGGADPPFFVE